jgi:hypothetical protein
MAPLGAGSHTIRLLGKSENPPEPVRLEEASLSAIFIPESSDLLACYDDDSEWSTSTVNYGTILKCTLQVPEDGWAFVTADATVRWQSLDQVLDLGFLFDSATKPEGGTHLGAHTGTWSYSPAATSFLKQVTKGDHSFSLVGRRNTGTGQVDVFYPVLNVIYIPTSSAYAVTCGGPGPATWMTWSSSWKQIQQCSLKVPTDAWAFVAASSPVPFGNWPHQAEFRLNAGDFGSVTREVKIYDTDAFGKRHIVAASLLKPISAGNQSFTFEGRRTLGPGTVLLTQPTLTAIVPLSTLEAPVLDAPADGAALCSGQPTFTWHGVDGATSHRIQVDDDSTFGSPEIDETVMGASYTVTAAQELSDGKYYWRVRGSSPLQVGPWSAARSFSVDPPATQVSLLTPGDATNLCGSQVFGWAQDKGATGYDIEVDNSPGFTSPEINDSTTHPDIDYEPATDLAPGSYVWHVRSTNACGDGPWSDTWSFIIPPGPDAPTLVSPADGSVIDDTTPTLGWTSVSGAMTYFVQVSQDPGFGSLAIDSFSATTSYTVPEGDALAKGTYYWKVRSENGCRTGDWSSPWKLIIGSSDHAIYLPLIVR